MSRKTPVEIGKKPERAILVGVALGRQAEAAEESLRELERLADTAGAEVVGRILQKREKIDPRSYLGRGKVEEIALEAKVSRADLLIFDNDLTPGQARNLEQDTKIRVLDRSELILDIFAKFARTHQAKVQVELAQLEYMYPRLRRMWTHLEKLGGGIGTRGPGESQLETDRRIIQTRIEKLKDGLREIESRKRREVRARASSFTVSLVGYTNAGKSSLLNRLTGAAETTRDQLFTTLDTRTRSWDLPGGRKALLSDTVGFLKNLPHHLVASFHATLEEARHAHLLLHVVDASHPNAAAHVEAVSAVLSEIGAGDRRQLLVLNKVDRIENWMDAEALRKGSPDAILVSAKTGKGIEDLAARVSKILEEEEVEVLVRTPASNGRAIHQLYERGIVRDAAFEDGHFVARVLCTKEALGRLRGEIEDEATTIVASTSSGTRGRAGRASPRS